MRPTKGVTQVACHSFCSWFVSCFIVINVAVTFNPQHKLQFVTFSQSEVVVCRYFLDSLSPLFNECRLLVITPWWASGITAGPLAEVYIYFIIHIECILHAVLRNPRKFLKFDDLCSEIALNHSTCIIQDKPFKCPREHILCA